MATDNLFTDSAEVPNTGEHFIYSQGVEKKYRIPSEQREIYEKYKDINRTNYVESYTSSFLGFSSVGLCLILLFPSYTRKYALYSLPVILLIWFAYANYLTIQGNENADAMNKILSQYEVNR